MNVGAADSDRASLIGANTALAVELYKRQASSGTGNLFLSPYSISARSASPSPLTSASTAPQAKASRLP